MKLYNFTIKVVFDNGVRVNRRTYKNEYPTSYEAILEQVWEALTSIDEFYDATVKSIYIEQVKGV